MQFFRPDINFDFMGKQRIFITISVVLVGISLIATFVYGLKYGIDFMGGTELQVRFAKDVDPGDVRESLSKIGFPSAEVVSVGAGQKEYMIRLQAVSPITEEKAASAKKSFQDSFKSVGLKKFVLSPGGDKLTVRLAKRVPLADVERAAKNAGLSLGASLADVMDGDKKVSAEGDLETEKTAESNKQCEGSTCSWSYQNQFVYEVSLKGVTDRIMDGLHSASFGQGAQRLRSEWVGPKVGKQLRTSAIWAIVYSLLFIMIYVAFRFDMRFAPGGIVALIHDVLITVGFFAVFQVEFTMATVAALLTIIGYSINDTIVVYDRIRENLSRVKGKDLISVINISVNQTMSRTVNTSLTVLFVVLAILIIGWNTSLRDFALALLIGVISGCYSTIFIASPVTAFIERHFYKKTE